MDIMDDDFAQQQQQQLSLKAAAVAMLEKMGLRRQEQQERVETETTLSQLTAEMIELRECVATQQKEIQDLKEALVVAQKGTNVKARIAFEEDVKQQMKIITQQLAVFKQQNEICKVYQKKTDILERDAEVLSETARILGRHQTEMVMQRDRGGYDGWVRFQESSQLWGKTQQELEEDWAILADYVQPEFIYELGISRAAYISEHSAKQTYERRYLNDDISDGRDYLDTLWRYRVTTDMLRPKRTLPRLETPIWKQIIREHCTWLGIEPSSESRRWVPGRGYI